MGRIFYIAMISAVLDRFSRCFHYCVAAAEHFIIYTNNMKKLKGSWRKMKKKIFNFFPETFENSKFVPQDSLIFRKLKYVPMSAYYGFVREIWRIKEVLVYLFLTQFTCIFLKWVYQELFKPSYLLNEIIICRYGHIFEFPKD